MTRHGRAILLTAVFLGAAVATLPADAAAQARRVVRRPPVRTGVAVARPYFYRPYYRPYYRSYYSPAIYGYYGGFAGWYGAYGLWYPLYAGAYYPPYAYGYGYPYPYRPYYAYSSDAQIKVQPREAQVYIDGYFVGRVDDFDGWLQRLHVAPGAHTLDVYMPGYRTYSEKVLFRPGATIKIERVLQPLGPGDPPDPRPTPSAAPTERGRQRPAREPAGRRPPSSAAPPPETPPAETLRGSGDVRAYGAIAVRVQPSDAQVLVDAQPWDSPEPGRLTVELSAGTHRVEVRREGFRTYSADIPVRPGETTTLNISLSRP